MGAGARLRLSAFRGSVVGLYARIGGAWQGLPLHGFINFGDDLGYSNDLGGLSYQVRILAARIEPYASLYRARGPSIAIRTGPAPEETRCGRLARLRLRKVPAYPHYLVDLRIDRFREPARELIALIAARTVPGAGSFIGGDPLIFADWLEEHGWPDEAERIRCAPAGRRQLPARAPARDGPIAEATREGRRYFPASRMDPARPGPAG